MAQILIKEASLFLGQGLETDSPKGSHFIRQGSVLIKDGLIHGIWDEDPPQDQWDQELTELIDGRGKWLMPGLVNAHTHLYSAFAKGLTGINSSSNFLEVLEDLWWKLDFSLTREACYFSALAGCIEAIKAGTTTLFDHHSAPVALGMDQILKGVKESGLRANCCFEITNRNGDALAQAGLEESESLLTRLQNDPNPLIKAMVGLHASFTLEDGTLEKAATLAEQFRTGCHIHLAEGPIDQAHCQENFGTSVVARLDSWGVLNERTLAAHALHLQENELELIKKRGCFLVHNPQSNMNNGVGIAPVHLWRKYNIPFGLGTDAMTANMLQEMRVGIWLQKLRSGNPSEGFNWAPEALLEGNFQLMQHAWHPGFGRIQTGSPADLILIDYLPSTPITDQNYLGHLVYGVSQCPVNTTIVNGKILMRNGRLTHLDEERIMKGCRLHAQKLWEAMKL